MTDPITPEARAAQSTECANCRTVAECYDDGEAYICVDTAACRLRQVYDLMGQNERLRQERDAYIRGQDEAAKWWSRTIDEREELRSSLAAAIARAEQLEQLVFDIRAYHNNYKGLARATHWAEIEEQIDAVIGAMTQEQHKQGRALRAAALVKDGEA